MKDKMMQLAKLRFWFDLTFFVRALTGVVRGRALFETAHGSSEAELKEGWKTLEKILDYLVTILPKWAHIHSTEDLNTTNVLIAPIVFLSRSGGKFSSEAEMKLFIRWLYAASAWARYSGQTDQRLDHDVSIVLQTTSPWKQLVDAIIDQRGRIELKAADLEGRGTQHPLYRMTYVLMKIHGAIDWFNGMPLDSVYGPTYGLHSHHIFPQSLLYSEGGYSADNHLHKQKVNEIANRAFLTGDSNTSLGSARPEEYIGSIDNKYPGALQKQFVPLNPTSWRLDQYETFLQQRRELIARAYNDQMKRLLQALPEPTRRPLPELIKDGESATLEFKSSLRWDVRTQQVNKDLQKVVAKTVAGLMNTEGGTLVIGVADDGSVYGIENDINSLSKKDRDGYEQTLVSVISAYLGAEFSPYYKLSYETINERTVCIVDVDHSPRPVFLTDGHSSEFYIRIGSTTRPLDLQTTFEYIGMHWETQ